MFESNLESLFLSSLCDSVHEVRNATIENIGVIVSLKGFGPTWAVEHLLPKIADQYSQGSSYSTRLTLVRALQKLAKDLNAEQASGECYKLVTKALKDTVPNVKLGGCECLRY